MLESMIKSPVPTRAEVSDIANAILDGTDAVMLSEETALGEYPLQAIEVMSRVSKRVESDYLHKQLLNSPNPQGLKGVGESINASAVRNADRIGAVSLVSLTQTGYSARMMSRHRPQHPILVFTPNPVAYQKSILSFGCYPVMIQKFTDFDQVLTVIRAHCLKQKIGKKGDRIVIASGMPFGKVIETNMLVVDTI